MQWFSLSSVKLSQEPQQSEAKVGSQEKRKLEKKIMYTVKNLSAVFLDYTPLGIETMTLNIHQFTK